eukprot:gene12148-biopygen16916
MPPGSTGRAAAVRQAAHQRDRVARAARRPARVHMCSEYPLSTPPLLCSCRGYLPLGGGPEREVGGRQPAHGMFFFPREGCPLSVSLSQDPPKSTENPQGSLRFLCIPPLVLASRSPRVRGRTFRSGAAFPSFRNLVAGSPRNSFFGGSLARGWCPGQGGWWCLAGTQASAGSK